MGPSCAGTEKFRNNKIHTMVAEALVPCIASTSGPIRLIMQPKVVFVFHMKGFELLLSDAGLITSHTYGHHKICFDFKEGGKSEMNVLYKCVPGTIGNS